MSFFANLNKIINKVIEKLYTNQDLMRYLGYDSDDPLRDDAEQPDIDGTTLVFKRLFPLPKVPDVNFKESTFINAYIEKSSLQNSNKGYRFDILYIDIFSKMPLWKMDNGIRVYSMINLIDEMFNDKVIEDISMQNILALGLTHRVFADDYHGYTLAYRLSNSANIICG